MIEAGDGLRADLEQIRAAREGLLLGHPDHAGLELVGDIRASRRDGRARRRARCRPRGRGRRVTASPAMASLQVAVHGDDAGDLRGLARGGDQHVVADLDDAGGDGAGEAAEIEVGAVHPLHREAHRLRRRGRSPTSMVSR